MARTRSFHLADLFEIVVDTVPERLALVAGTARRTYAELDERANRTAHALAERGVQSGDHVAIIAWNRVEWIETMLALWKVCAVPINVNYRYVAAEIDYMLDNSDSTFVVCEPEFVAVLDEVAPQTPRLVIGPELDAALAAASPRRDGFPERSGDDRYLLYTGGTTGLPKGVEWRHEDIFFAALGGGGFGQPPITEPDELAGRMATPEARAVTVCNAPMMHGGGQWVSCIGFFGGGTVVLNTEHHFDPHWVWRTAEAEGANAVMVVGDAMGRPLVEALAAGGPDGPYDASGVFVIGSGGGILSRHVKDELRTLLPGAMVMDSFGASETGAGGSVMDLDGPAAGPRFSMGPFMSVLDDDLRPVPAGSGRSGRLARSGHIPLGYYKDAEKTYATFVTDAEGRRWVVPGDHAVIEADGTITVLGRGSGCINTGGEKVYPEEVEEATKSHPAVFDCVVVGVPDTRFVERVCALVSLRRGAPTPTLDEVQAHCRQTIAGYKVPRELRVLDHIVRTPVGKPDYRWAKQVATSDQPGAPA